MLLQLEENLPSLQALLRTLVRIWIVETEILNSKKSGS